MKKTLLALALIGSAIGLSACGGHSAFAPPPPPTPPPVEAKFGAGFAQDYQAPSNTTPAAVKSGDIIPVDPTLTPTSLH